MKVGDHVIIIAQSSSLSECTAPDRSRRRQLRPCGSHDHHSTTTTWGGTCSNTDTERRRHLLGVRARVRLLLHGAPEQPHDTKAERAMY